ncbi:hypothetical protein D3C71_1941160 [compost metagenome]
MAIVGHEEHRVAERTKAQRHRVAFAGGEVGHGTRAGRCAVAGPRLDAPATAAVRREPQARPDDGEARG